MAIKKLYTEVVTTLVYAGIKKILIFLDDPENDFEKEIGYIFLRNKLIILAAEPVIYGGRFYRAFTDEEIFQLLTDFELDRINLKTLKRFSLTK